MCLSVLKNEKQKSKFHIDWRVVLSALEEIVQWKRASFLRRLDFLHHAKSSNTKIDWSKSTFCGAKNVTSRNMFFKSSFGLFQEATASQKYMKSWMTPEGFRLIMLQMPRNAESFSSLSRILRSEEHHGRMNCCRWGATSSGHTNPRRPIVIAAKKRMTISSQESCPQWKRTGIFKQRLWCVGLIKVNHKLGQNYRNVRLHLLFVLDRNFTNGPGSIVAHRDEFRFQVLRQNGHVLA